MKRERREDEFHETFNDQVRDNEPCPLSYTKLRQLLTTAHTENNRARLLAHTYTNSTCELKITIKFSHKLYFSVI